MLIGTKGETRYRIENMTKTSLNIESESGEVFIENKGEDPLSSWKARDMVKAIGRGFSPEKAFLLQNDNNCFYMIELHEFLKKSGKQRF